MKSYATTCNSLRKYKASSSDQNQTEKPLKVYETCVAGGIAGFAQSFVRSPVERIKTVMQTTKRPDGSSYYKTTLSCIIDLVKTQGISGGLMRGLTATIAREVCVFLFILFFSDQRNKQK